MPRQPRPLHVCSCIDDAARAGSAIAEAHRLAGEEGRVSVLHVAPPVPVLRGALSEWGEVDRDEPLATAAKWLEATVEVAGGGEPVLLSGDPPGQVACRWAAEHDVDLMITGSRSTGLRREVLGSFAADLAAGAPCPVLLLAAGHHDEQPPAPPAGPYAHVAGVTDGSAGSLRALDASEEIATRGRSRITVVLLRSRIRAALDALTGAGDSGEWDELERRSRELTGTTPQRRTGRAGAALSSWARSETVDLVVVTEETPLGSALRRTVGRLAAEGTCSVLVTRPPASEAGPRRRPRWGR